LSPSRKAYTKKKYALSWSRNFGISPFYNKLRKKQISLDIERD
jgi:hypothetical protein